MALIRACLVCLLVFIFFVDKGHSKQLPKSVTLKTIHASLNSDYGTLQAEIHFDERDAVIAEKVEQIIKSELIKVVNYFHYVPRGLVHFNVDPYMRLSNGNARVFTSNIINLYNFPSSNADHLIVMEDWLRGLVFHEYIHITHLDQTRGYLDDGRTIFGSIAKLPANVVPRWFTEGIAVWGESHLLEGGRLDNQLFRKELLIQFLREDFCDSIDCLDDPGVYPHGSLAYWAGSHFIEYIESLKAGSVRCLVEENSSAIPFLLNRAFVNCTGKTAQDHFADFREKIIQSAGQSNRETWGDKINNAFGSDNFQKGFLLDQERLFKIENDRYTEALMSYDLSEPGGMSLIKMHYRYPISDLSGIVSGISQEGEPLKYLLVSFNEDPHYRIENKKWKLINSDTLLIEKHLPFINDPSYVIALGNYRYLTASYIDNQWIIEKQKLNELDRLVEAELIRKFPANVNIVAFSKAGEKLLLKIHDGDKARLLIADPTATEITEAYSSENYFELPVVHERFMVISEGEKKTLIEFQDHNNILQSQIDAKLLKNVTAAQLNDGRVLFLENRLKTKLQTLDQSLSFLKQNATTAEAKTLQPFKLQEPAVSSEDMHTEKYPQLYHLSPNYWFLATGSGENISSIGAMTTLVDPMAVHTIDATALLFPSISRIGGTLSYFYRVTPVTDLWSVNAFFEQDYSRSELNNVLMSSREWGAGTAYTFLLKRWSYVPGVYLTQSHDEDFLSERTINSVGLKQTLTYESMSFEDLAQSMITQIKLQRDEPDQGNHYLNLQSRFFLLGRFSERLEMGVQSAYGKLFKNDFRRGVIYGGGIDSVVNQRWFEFYGIPYSNAYGNEIFTFRLFAEYNFWNIYRGKNFIPIFFKEAHFLLGRETMYADRIFLDNSLIREKAVNSFFGGVRLKTNIFYYVPTDLDLIFSSTRHPSGQSVQAVNFTINAELF